MVNKGQIQGEFRDFQDISSNLKKLNEELKSKI